LINGVDYFAPKCKCDHAISVITCMWHSKICIDNSVGYGFNKGEHAFRSYVNNDWFCVFDDRANDVESMWIKYKDIQINGTTLFLLFVAFLRGARQNEPDTLIQIHKISIN